MPDHILAYADLLSIHDLRSRTYVVEERDHMAVVSLQARRAGDRFFARRWINTSTGRRLLYWLLDEVEAAGFRFQVGTRAPRLPPANESISRETAASLLAQLSPEESRIHADLFPDEARLLADGYDWDAKGPSRHGTRFPTDGIGRILETRDGTVYEWVLVPEEWAWRRYPIALAGVP